MSKVSDFYLACRNGDINKVEQLLPTLSSDEINRLEPNDSTALHAASYYGHSQIILRMLKRGDILFSIRNKYDKTPYEEAGTPEIAQLLTRPPTNAQDRFVDNASAPVWIFRSNHANFIAQMNYNETITQTLDHTIDALGYIDGKVKKEHINLIKYFLEELKRTRDVTYLLRLYTAETDFYRLLNEAIATKLNAMSRVIVVESHWAMCFAGVVCRDTALDHLRWAGDETTNVTYRGMHITESDLSQYEVDEKIMNRSFLSTSKDRSIAEDFLKIPTAGNKLPVLCIYTIIDKRAALDVHSVSEFPHEQEILIVPWMAFVVKRKEMKNPIEIHLEQLPME
ncbi:unnamed protein product [Adineta steineri]|uniref:NAD(P)(+)--arginine ADP-ribosyltransferase n=1 Tax=Adineta steineri TaxID=433720 RepID=A0A816BN11_9BILA|nr:unnamed protein product [Adineta steineri]CAF1610391.1 unnamed protein product [Adineta steineri]